MDPILEKKINNRRNHRIAAGVILILLGVATLFQRWFDIGNYIVLLLGLGMLIWGSISHRTGWIIPGGVLSGIGLGILAMEGPWQLPSREPERCIPDLFRSGLVPHHHSDRPLHLHAVVGAHTRRDHGRDRWRHSGHKRDHPLVGSQPGLCRHPDLNGLILVDLIEAGRKMNDANRIWQQKNSRRIL